MSPQAGCEDYYRNLVAQAEGLRAENERLLLLLADETYREEGGRIVVGQLIEARSRADAAEAKVRAVEAVAPLIESLRERVDADPDRHGCYVPRATLRDVLAALARVPAEEGS